MEPTDVVLLVLRLWLGSVMLAHGLHHARSLDGTASWFASKGFRHAPVQARMSAVGELAIGTGLAAGAVTSLAAAGLIATMFVAFWSIHRAAGFFVFARPDEGWEYVGTLMVAALAVAVLGPGEISVDAGLGIAANIDGWVGGTIALGGLGAAAAQLAMTWRTPTTESPS